MPGLLDVTALASAADTDHDVMAGLRAVWGKVLTLTDDTAVHGSPVELWDGSLGYNMGRPDQCFQAAVATVVQVPMEQVPDSHADERWAQGENPADIAVSMWVNMIAWLDGRGLRPVLHRTVPVNRRRWIGVVIPPNARPLGGHTLVMSNAELLHDPSLVFAEKLERRNPGVQFARLDPADITYGLSFRRKKG